MIKFKCPDGTEFEDFESALSYCVDELGMLPSQAEARIEESFEEEYPKYKSRFCDENPNDPRCQEHQKKIHGSIEEEPEETPDEMGEVLLQEDLERKLKITKNLENYSETKETEKGEALADALNETKKETTPYQTKSDRIQEEYLGFLEKFRDQFREVCPLCGEAWPKPSVEQLSWLTDHPELGEIGVPPIRLVHCITKHPGIAQFMVEYYKIPVQLPHAAQPFTSNPEHCSKEELSGIDDDKKFLEELSEKTEEHGVESLSEDERNRLFTIWRSLKRKR